MPFSSSRYDDFRPILSAASRAFNEGSILEPGIWDDLSFWLGIPDHSQSIISLSPKSAYKIGNKNSWASLRTVQYDSRPAHADQLHVDLWYQGHNITLDPGTFQYNAPPPWDNGLATSFVHNTLTINGKDQMLRVGRFLWLDWAQAFISTGNENMLCAEHDGYKNLNISHRRELIKISNKVWKITDYLSSQKKSRKNYHTILHWLLPDLHLKRKSNTFSFSAPFGSFDLQISSGLDTQSGTFNVFHKGKDILDTKNDRPLLGWYSPTYGIKNPAYSIIFSLKSRIPIKITSKFTF